MIRLDRNPGRGITSVSRTVYRLAIGVVASQAAMAGLRSPPRLRQVRTKTDPRLIGLPYPTRVFPPYRPARRRRTIFPFFWILFVHVQPRLQSSGVGGARSTSRWSVVPSQQKGDELRSRRAMLWWFTDRRCAAVKLSSSVEADPGSTYRFGSSLAARWA